VHLYTGIDQNERHQSRPLYILPYIRAGFTPTLEDNSNLISRKPIVHTMSNSHESWFIRANGMGPMSRIVPHQRSDAIRHVRCRMSLTSPINPIWRNCIGSCCPACWQAVPTLIERRLIAMVAVPSCVSLLLCLLAAVFEALPVASDSSCSNTELTCLNAGSITPAVCDALTRPAMCSRDAFLAQTRCKCPPGFLGPRCEIITRKRAQQGNALRRTVWCCSTLM
jgi:hypothetical protein